MIVDGAPLQRTGSSEEEEARAHLDGSDGEGDLPPAIDVRVENTKNVLELLGDDQRLEHTTVKTRQSHQVGPLQRGIRPEPGNPRRVRLTENYLSTAHVLQVQQRIHWR